MKFEPDTYFRKPCVLIREGQREASVAVRVAGVIEHRKGHHLGRRGCGNSRRQHVCHRYGERTHGSTVSNSSWTHVRTLSGSGSSPSCPAVVRGRLGKAEEADALECTRWRSQIET